MKFKLSKYFKLRYLSRKWRAWESRCFERIFFGQNQDATKWIFLSQPDAKKDRCCHMPRHTNVATCQDKQMLPHAKKHKCCHMPRHTNVATYQDTQMLPPRLLSVYSLCCRDSDSLCCWNRPNSCESMETWSKWSACDALRRCRQNVVSTFNIIFLLSLSSSPVLTFLLEGFS